MTKGRRHLCKECLAKIEQSAHLLGEVTLHCPDSRFKAITNAARRRYQSPTTDAQSGETRTIADQAIAFPHVILAPTEIQTEELEGQQTEVTSAPCPVCVYPIASDEFDMVTLCDRCRALYHTSCFWRGLPVGAWVGYITSVDADEEPDVVCAACRQREGLEK
jgi:hypothetical protein